MEYERLLEAAAQNPRDFALIQVFLQTGIKLAELTRLTMNDVELPSVILLEENDVGHLHILGSRSKKERIIPLNSKACIALKTLLKERTGTLSSTLLINRFGKPLGARGVEKIIERYLTKVRISGANVQSLRHTFGVHQIASGADLSIIQEVMGHRDSRTISMYLTLARQMMSKQGQLHSQ